MNIEHTVSVSYIKNQENRARVKYNSPTARPMSPQKEMQLIQWHFLPGLGL